MSHGNSLNNYGANDSYRLLNTYYVPALPQGWEGACSLFRELM